MPGAKPRLLAGTLLTLVLVPSVSSAPQESAPAAPQSKAALRYDLEPGTNYVYRVHVEGEEQSHISVKSGEVWYQLAARRKPDPPEPMPGDDELEASGTAFVVNTAGYLVSCAHLVKDARQIEVTLGDKKYAATVVETDVERDLALLKIDTTGLSALRLADSDRVELGQEARAVGFPLSTILGDSLKVTRGTIAGFVTDRDFGHRVFQIDAGLNPGNSGGPLVNEMGEAIGVNFAKLDDALANNVGFATPINYVRRLLEKRGVAFDRGDSTTPLDGPELVRGVAPAVAYVHMKMAPPVPDEILQLRSRSYFRESTRRKGTDAPESREERELVRTRRPIKIEIDERGNVWEQDKSDDLPWMLGTTADVLFTPFPERSQAGWDVEFQTGVTVSFSSRSVVPTERFARGPRRYGYPGFFDRANPYGRSEPAQVQIETATVLIPAVERHRYRISERSGDEAVIQKEIEFKTLANEGLGYEMTAKARIVFDTRAGVPKSMKLTGELVGRNGDRQETTPFWLEYRLIATRPASEDAFGRELVETMTLPKTGSPLDQVLADSASQQDHVAQRALRTLIGTPPEDPIRRDVARMLIALLSDPDGTMRSLAVDALVAWSSDETVPSLIARLNHSGSPGREECFLALARIGDPRAVTPIAEQLRDIQARGAAVRALVSIGTPLVEQAVAVYAAEPDAGTQEGVCQVLESVGTEQSLDALRRLLAAPANERVAQAAYRALSQIFVRAGKPLPEDIVAPRPARNVPRPVVPAEPRNLPPLLRIFEDEAEFAALLNHGGGTGTLDTNDRYSGSAALRVTPVQMFNPHLDQLNVAIRERPGPDEYRYLRFAWKKPAGRKPIGLQIACNGGWQLRYHSGAERNPWGDSKLVSPDLPVDWVVVTRDLFAENGEFLLTGIALDAFDGDYALFDHVYLARSLADFASADEARAPAAAPKVPETPAPAPGAAPPPPPGDPLTAANAKVLRIFEDEPALAASLDGGLFGGTAELVRGGQYSGNAALRVTPVQVVNPRIPGLAARIRERPGQGEFRYLRFAWRKPTGTEPIGLQLASDGRWAFRLHSGPGRVRWGDSTRVDAELPREWTVVTRDLFADFGAFTLTGIALDAFDGQGVVFDHIYLARSPEDFDAPDE